jgi:hypothetical protein
MKKKLLVFTISITFVLVLVGIAVYIFSKAKPTSPSEHGVVNFSQNESDFDAILATVDRYRSTVEGSTYPYIYVSYEVGGVSLSFNGGKVMLSKAEEESLKAISDSFPESVGTLSTISCYPGRISFDTEPKHYSIVYTKDDSVPKYLFRPDENRIIRVEKIQPHWYHVFSG